MKPSKNSNKYVDQFQVISVPVSSLNPYETILPLDNDYSIPRNIECPKNYDGIKEFNPHSTSSCSSSNSSDCGEEFKTHNKSTTKWNGKQYKLNTVGQEKFRTSAERNFQMSKQPSYSIVKLEYDAHYRAENPGSSADPPVGNGIVLWNNVTKNGNMNEIPCDSSAGVNLSSSSTNNISKNFDNSSDSETDPEISEYIQQQEDKRKCKASTINEPGSEFEEDIIANITGETFWYDRENSIVRNLHVDSISLTNYSNLEQDKIHGTQARNNVEMFGKNRIFHQILTPEERKLIGLFSIDSKSVQKTKLKEGNNCSVLRKFRSCTCFTTHATDILKLAKWSSGQENGAGDVDLTSSSCI